jgi:hypothetical protein
MMFPSTEELSVYTTTEPKNCDYELVRDVVIANKTLARLVSLPTQALYMMLLYSNVIR